MHSSMNRGISVKIVLVSALVLVLLLPLTRIRALVAERHDTQKEAQANVQESWGGPQTLIGPMLNVPSSTTADVANLTVHHVLPDSLVVNCRLETELRTKGLFQIPVYRAHLQIEGSFAAKDLAAFAEHGSDDLDWSQGYLSLYLDQARTLQPTIELRIADREATIEPPRHVSPFTKDALESPVDLSDLRMEDIRFSLVFDLHASESIHIAPIARSTQIEMTSNWNAPFFSGTQLPDSHTIDDDGFSARWRVGHYGRQYPSFWTGPKVTRAQIEENTCGVKLYVESSIYQISERSVKYAILFIVLTFFGFFLFELLAHLAIHPIQYGMVGIGLCLFYLLLLALGEHFPFGVAYFISTLAEIALVSCYAKSVLKSGGRAFIMAAILAAIYGYLWIVIIAVDYALLMGALALFGALALLMYLTRHIDWYALTQINSQPPPVPEP